jgi:predicted  nucleic acid-binding Zn-ribbon protein
MSTVTGKEDAPVVAPEDEKAIPKPKRNMTPKPLVKVARELGNAKDEYAKLEKQAKRHEDKAAELKRKIPALLERIKKAASALAAATK